MYNKEGFLEMGVSPEQAPDKPEYVTISFEKGIPVKLNGEALDGVTMIEKLNEIGGRNGVGITDIVENRLVGMKARGVYETPGGTVLYAAHSKLEEICLDKDTLHYKKNLANTFADLVYDGKWYTPLREAMSAFVDSTQEYVTGPLRIPSMTRKSRPSTRTRFTIRTTAQASSTSSDFPSRSARRRA